MAKNVTFIYPCVSDRGTIAPVGAAWPDSLENLQDYRTKYVARSADADPANTAFTIDLGERQLIGGIAGVRHNLSIFAKWRATVSDNADMSAPLFDTGVVDVWGVVYPYGSLPWGSPNWWDGQMSERTRQSYPGLLVALLPLLVVGRYVRIELFDENNTDGYVELGRIYVGEAWTPQRNASWGASIKWDTATTVDTAIDGTDYFDRREGLRTWAFALDWLTSAEAFGTVFEMQRTLGIDQQLFIMFEPSDTPNLLRKSFLGTLKQLNPISYPHVAVHGVGFEIKESR